MIIFMTILSNILKGEIFQIPPTDGALEFILINAFFLGVFFICWIFLSSIMDDFLVIAAIACTKAVCFVGVSINLAIIFFIAYILILLLSLVIGYFFES